MEVTNGSGEQFDASKPRLTRGIWIWNTKQLVQDLPQLERLFELLKATAITDVYLYVAPPWYMDEAAGIAALNTCLHTAGIRTWAVGGDRAVISGFPEADGFISDLTKLGDFNDGQDPSARFHGFQAYIDPGDTDTMSEFHDDVPESRLKGEQRLQRDVLLHQWFNVLTRASNLVHSFLMVFGAVVPHWLHNYRGESVHVNWAGEASSKSCALDLIQPIVDELVVLSYSSSPAVAVSRVAKIADYAEAVVRPGDSHAKIIASLEVPKDGWNGDAADASEEKRYESAVCSVVQGVEGGLREHPSFIGTMVHSWAVGGESPT